MSSMRWSQTAWAFSLALCCASVWIVADPATAQPVDSLVIRYVPGADGYLVPRALVADYVACATEAEALRRVEAEAARVIGAQDSLALVLRERSEVAQKEALACSRALGLSEGRVRALGAAFDAAQASAGYWRAAARSAEQRARGWRTAALVAGSVGVLVGVVW